MQGLSSPERKKIKKICFFFAKEVTLEASFDLFVCYTNTVELGTESNLCTLPSTLSFSLHLPPVVWHTNTRVSQREEAMTKLE